MVTGDKRTITLEVGHAAVAAHKLNVSCTQLIGFGTSTAVADNGGQNSGVVIGITTTVQF